MKKILLLLAALAMGLPAAGQASPTPTTFGHRYEAYAPPNVFGNWYEVGAHLGAATFKITARPLGNSAIVGEVHYFAEDGRETIKPFTQEITIRTANGVAAVKVRFKGIPTGTAVEVEVD
ncbi:MAG: hypothetical protein ABSE84_20745 [Isosphaeraceae bacterium]|jgi:hypothetical protein